MKREQREPSNVGFVRPTIMSILGLFAGATAYQSSGSIFMFGFYGVGTMIIVVLLFRVIESNFIFLLTLILAIFLWLKFS